MARQKRNAGDGAPVAELEVEVTYVGPCARFVDDETGNVFVNGESTSVDVDTARRLLIEYGQKFVSKQAHVELVFDEPEPVAEPEDPLRSLLVEPTEPESVPLED